MHAHKRTVMALLRDKRGAFADGGGMFLFCVVFVIFLTFTMQLNIATRTTSDVQERLNKAATIAIKASVLDQYRKDFISRIDTDLAEAVFYDFLIENMHMIERGDEYHLIKADSTESQYWFEITEATFEAGGSADDLTAVPKITVSVVLHIPVTILPKYLAGQSFEVPLRIVATNQRIV